MRCTEQRIALMPGCLYTVRKPSKRRLLVFGFWFLVSGFLPLAFGFWSFLSIVFCFQILFSLWSTLMPSSLFEKRRNKEYFMKKTGTILFVGSIILLVWAILLFIFNAISYASYIDYYGLVSVLPTMLDGVPELLAFALVLYGMSSYARYLADKDEVVQFDAPLFEPAAYEPEEIGEETVEPQQESIAPAGQSQAALQ